MGRDTFRPWEFSRQSDPYGQQPWSTLHGTHVDDSIRLVAKRLRDVLREARTPVEEAAPRVGMSVSSLRRKLHGERHITFTELVNIAVLTGRHPSSSCGISMSAPDGIESIIRRIMREEIDRAAAVSQSGPAVDERKLLYSVADVAAVTGLFTQYIRNDIRSGQLADTQPSGSKYLIGREAASRYALWLQAGRP